MIYDTESRFFKMLLNRHKIAALKRKLMQIEKKNEEEEKKIYIPLVKEQAKLKKELAETKKAVEELQFAIPYIIANFKVNSEKVCEKIQYFYIAVVCDSDQNFFEYHEVVLKIGIIVTEFLLDMRDFKAFKSDAYHKFPTKLINLLCVRDTLSLTNKFDASHHHKIESIISDLDKQIEKTKEVDHFSSIIYIDKTKIETHSLVKKNLRVFNFTKTLTYQYVRSCSFCDHVLLTWFGCPCKQAWYCGKSCQKKDWTFHKTTCTC